MPKLVARSPHQDHRFLAKTAQTDGATVGTPTTPDKTDAPGKGARAKRTASVADAREPAPSLNPRTAGLAPASAGEAAARNPGAPAGTTARLALRGWQAPPFACHIEGNKAIGPAGEVYASTFRLGLFNPGATAIQTFVEQHPELLGALSPSLVAVAKAVSPNEGCLDAINTWDNSFLSVGCFQWTAGTDDSAGELPAVVAALERDNPEAFARLFGQYGLGVSGVDFAEAVPRGFFTYNGELVDNAAKKEGILRTPEMAYLFWKAAQDPAFQSTEVTCAARRVFAFLDGAVAGPAPHTVRNYVTSEYGVAQLLDEHVNRPGHVLETLAAAVAGMAAGPSSPDPAVWSTLDEGRLLEQYLALRAATNMTDSTARAQRIAQAADAGVVSRERGSFVT